MIEVHFKNILKKFCFPWGVISAKDNPIYWAVKQNIILCSSHIRYPQPSWYTSYRRKQIFNLNWSVWQYFCFNSSYPGQNGCYFTDDTFKSIFMNENFCILIRISLKLVPKVPINNNPTLVQIMAWRPIGDKSLFEPLLIRYTDAYMRH